jgi:hypothetical protein
VATLCSCPRNGQQFKLHRVEVMDYGVADRPQGLNDDRSLIKATKADFGPEGAGLPHRNRTIGKSAPGWQGAWLPAGQRVFLLSGSLPTLTMPR